MKTLRQYVESARNLRNQSNESLLKLHNELKEIKEGEFWKQQEFYNGQNDFIFHEYSKMTFNAFIKSVFQYTMITFNNMEKILSLKDGESLFLKYGYTNMNVYYNSSETERTAILDAIETKGRLSDFRTVKRDLFPPAKKKIDTGSIQEKHNQVKKELVIAKEEIKALKSKKTYKAMKAELDAAKKEIKRLETENKRLKETLEQYRTWADGASMFISQAPDFKKIENTLHS